MCVPQIAVCVYFLDLLQLYKIGLLGTLCFPVKHLVR